jgi:hypothetical protein
VDSQDKFRRWFVEPLRTLRTIPNGDGGFVALAVGCFLYERYAVAVFQQTPSPGSKVKPVDRFVKQLAADFQVDETTAEAFWKVFRDGLLHFALPKLHNRGTPIELSNPDSQIAGYAMSAEFPAPIQLSGVRGAEILRVQPWLFADRVVELWERNSGLLDSLAGSSWPSVGPLPA